MNLTARGREKYDEERFKQQKIYCDTRGRMWNHWYRMIHNGMSTERTRIQLGYKSFYTGVAVMLTWHGLPGESDIENNRFTVGHIGQDGKLVRSDAPAGLAYQSTQEQNRDSARNNPAQYAKAWDTRRSTTTLVEAGVLAGEVWFDARYNTEAFERYSVSSCLRVHDNETDRLLPYGRDGLYPVVRLVKGGKQRYILLHKLGHDSANPRTPEDLHLQVAHIVPILSTDTLEEAVYKSRPAGVRLLPARDNLMERDSKLYDKVSLTSGRAMLCIHKEERITGVFHSLSACTEHTGVPSDVIARCMSGERSHALHLGHLYIISQCSARTCWRKFSSVL